MKVNIRREEIKAILSAYFRVDVDDFTISPNDPSKMGKMVRNVVTKPLDNTGKLGNIRVLREFSDSQRVYMTLQEGKWALEHWLEWISFVDEYNRLPLAGYGSSKAFGKLE
jgi:hypothetical protein